MTNLEQIIREVTTRSTVTAISDKVDHLAEEMARELLADPAVRAHLLLLVRKAFEDTWASMNQQPTPSQTP